MDYAMKSAIECPFNDGIRKRTVLSSKRNFPSRSFPTLARRVLRVYRRAAIVRRTAARFNGENAHGGFDGLKVCNLHAFARGVVYACKNRRGKVAFFAFFLFFSFFTRHRKGGSGGRGESPAQRENTQFKGLRGCT